MTKAEMLAIHNRVWDMPTLVEEHPEVVHWLAERYEIHFGMVSEVIIVPRARVYGAIRYYETTDVRVAVRNLLSEEDEAPMTEDEG